ncbi:hypothetical protein OH805_06705 [Streptomyces sp. NBC_00879]|uniref:hypothetical protein n=1 Tax=Streptomyces sp. NBC_00879 TaxID=2975855 RepID=UPI00386B47B4|nr:hypothetical protein OH805_06705 [Streptomyces sp. NBC_00879]
MSDSVAHVAGDPDVRGLERAGRIGSVVCASLLGLGHLVTGYVLLLAYMVEPGTSETGAHSGVASGLGLAFAIATALLTILFVKAGWLRRRWLAVPAALAVAAILRLTVLAPGL